MISLLKAAVLPSNLIVMLAVAGLLATCMQRWRRTGMLLLSAVAVMYLAFANGVVANLLLSPLEYTYATLRDTRPYPDVRHIVLLTAYASTDPELPASSRLDSSAAFRVLEAATVFRQDPLRTIIVSGASRSAHGMKEQLVNMGVPPERISMETDSATTADSAENLREIVGNEGVILITSAGHMRRAMAALQRQGIRAIPCPTDHQLPRRLVQSSWKLSPFHLRASDLAIHEHLGLLWYRITGKA